MLSCLVCCVSTTTHNCNNKSTDQKNDKHNQWDTAGQDKFKTVKLISTVVVSFSFSFLILDFELLTLLFVVCCLFFRCRLPARSIAVPKAWFWFLTSPTGSILCSLLFSFLLPADGLLSGLVCCFCVVVVVVARKHLNTWPSGQLTAYETHRKACLGCWSVLFVFCFCLL